MWSSMRGPTTCSLKATMTLLISVALDQVIKYKGRYYAYYHASGHPKWKEWSTNLAVSTDLVHWKMNPGSPVLPVDPNDPQRSSAFLVPDGKRFRLYATHPDVKVFVSKQNAEQDK